MMKYDDTTDLVVAHENLGSVVFDNEIIAFSKTEYGGIYMPKQMYNSMFKYTTSNFNLSKNAKDTLKRLGH